MESGEIWIETYNCNLDPKIREGRLESQMDGVKLYNRAEQGIGIYLYQEIGQDIFDFYNNAGRVTPNKNLYCDQVFCYTINRPKVKMPGMLMSKQFSFKNVAERGKAKNWIVDSTNSYNAVVWTPSFKLLGIHIPGYMVSDKDDLDWGNRIGSRTTPWVILHNRENNTHYAAISIHGNSGPANIKRHRLLKSLCADIETIRRENPGIKFIVGGDLNMTPDEVVINSTNALVTKDMIQTPLNTQPSREFKYNIVPCGGLIHTCDYDIKQKNFIITHWNKNPETGEIFQGKLDWLFVSNDLDVTFSITDDVKTDKNPNILNPSDHAPVRIKVKHTGAQNGGDYKEKYMKYKNKYLNLKAMMKNNI